MHTKVFSSEAEKASWFAQRVSYNPETGVFVLPKGFSIYQKADSLTIRAHTCGLDRQVEMKAHKLAWFIVHGGLYNNVRHADGNPTNNRIANLTCTVREKPSFRTEREKLEWLAKHVFYNPDTGELRALGPCVTVHLNKGGYPTVSYRQVGSWRVQVLAHRLAFFLVHGRVPACIDHIDSNRANNRTNNLREASQRTNSIRRIDFDPDFPGVHWHGQVKKWRARIEVAGRSVHLVVADSQAEAGHAYQYANTLLQNDLLDRKREFNLVPEVKQRIEKAVERRLLPRLQNMKAVCVRTGDLLPENQTDDPTGRTR